MRIVAGRYGGRRLQAPAGSDIRPTSDKVRGALFNALHSRGAVQGMRVLDAFCGSGALGLEALSRGAVHCTFMDKARRSLDLARANADAFGIGDEARFVCGDAARATGLSGGYDLVFLDPPYGRDLVMPTLSVLHAQDLLCADAVIVIEAEKSFPWAGHEAYGLLDERVYGQTQICYLVYKPNTP